MKLLSIVVISASLISLIDAGEILRRQSKDVSATMNENEDEFENARYEDEEEMKDDECGEGDGPYCVPFKKLEKRIHAAEWGALHMAAAAACQGLAPKGGDGPWSNRVRAKNPHVNCVTTCKHLGFKCNAHVAINGLLGKATHYSQEVGSFYNYGCARNGHNIDEITSSGLTDSSKDTWNYYHYCCCKK